MTRLQGIQILCLAQLLRQSADTTPTQYLPMYRTSLYDRYDGMFLELTPMNQEQECWARDRRGGGSEPRLDRHHTKSLLACDNHRHAHDSGT
jgi:hypothetical protein